MTSAEALRPPSAAPPAPDLPAGPPGPVDLMLLLGWPWMLGLVLLLASPFSLLLGDPWGRAAALGSAGLAALLALGGGLLALRRLVEEAAAALATQDLPQALRALLQEQRSQTQQAGMALSRAVTAGAQLSSLARGLDKQLRPSLEQAGHAVLREHQLDGGLARLQALVERAETAQTALPHRLETVLARLESAIPAEALSRIEHCARQLDAAGAGLPRLAGLTAQLGGDAQRLQQATASLEDLLAGAARPMAPAPLPAPDGAALEPQLQALSHSIDRLTRNEASLGDAARYLTETTDRFAEQTGQLETHAVRLQAMIRISGERDPRAEVAPLCAALEQQLTLAEQLGQRLQGTQQQMAAALSMASEVAAMRDLTNAQPSPSLAPAALPVDAQAALEQLGQVEHQAAQLLRQASALGQQPWPALTEAQAPALVQGLEQQLEALQAVVQALAPLRRRATA